MRPPPRALVPALFAVLVVATGAALAESQRLKTQPAIIDQVRVGGPFYPNGDCRQDEARIRFRLTRDETVTLKVTRPSGRPIRTLFERREMRSYRHYGFLWDGINDAGEPAETGPYRVTVTLHELDREFAIGGRVRLHRSAYRPLPGCEKEQVTPPLRSDEDRALDEAYG